MLIGLSAVPNIPISSFYRTQVEHYRAQVVFSVMGEPVASEPRLFVGQVRSLVSLALLTLPSGMYAAQAGPGGSGHCGASVNLISLGDLPTAGVPGPAEFLPNHEAL